MVRRIAGTWLPAVLVGVVAFVGALVAMMPGVSFWDTAELQTVAPVLGTAHPTGFPTYVLLGWVANVLLTPFGDPAFRMNLFAGLCVAVAAAVTVDLVRALTRSALLGVMAGLGLAFTGIVWKIGTHAEAHALHLALVAILLRLLVAWEDGRRDRALVGAAVVFGLAAGNHSLTLLLALPIALYVAAVDRDILRRPRFVVGCVGVAVLTVALVYLELPLRAGPFRASIVYGQPETWDGFWYIALAEQFRGSLVAPFSDLPVKAADLVNRSLDAFGPLALFVPLAFVVTALRRPSYALLTGSALAITCFFNASYVNAMIDRYYVVPVLIAWTWLAIFAEGIARMAGTRVDDDGRTALHPVVATVLAVVLLVPTALGLGDRYQAVDRSQDDTAARWLDMALSSMDRDAVIVSWWSYSTPLWYAQVIEGRRPDISIIDDRTRLDQNLGDIYDVIDRNLPTRPVYVIRIEPSEIAGIAERYETQPIGAFDPSMLSRVIRRREVAQ
jgi:transmembrane protein TMEM260 (protein O-mannosyltransferase)